MYRTRIYHLRIGNGPTGRTPYPTSPNGWLGILLMRLPLDWRWRSL